MPSDIVPDLLEDIQKDFQRQFKSNSKVINIYGKIKSHVATYKEANEFSIECGEMLARAFKKYLTADVLPEGRMWYNIATRILTPTLRTNYSLITDVTNATQQIFNDDNGIGLSPITPAFNTNRLNGLIDKVSNAEHYEDVEWVMDEPIVNFSQSIVDQAIKDNADFQYNAGMTPKIRRTVVGGCCEWCQALAGTYDYPYVPSDIYRKHERCRCTVEYISANKKQNVWTKKTEYFSEETPAERQKRLLNEQKEQQAVNNRMAEKNTVQELLRQHPDWSEKGATIYYRTHLATRS